MQNLTSDELDRVDMILRADRQWRREERIKHARREFKLAYRRDPEMVSIRKAILRRLDYDYIDKVNKIVKQEDNENEQ